MSHLKNENAAECFSILREYIDETALNTKKGIAVLALNQLQKITAGTDSQDSPIDSNPGSVLGSGCHGRPMAGSSGG